MNYIRLGKESGDLVTGGGAPAEFADSLFVAPTIFDNIDNSSRIAQEEIFGPVLCVIPFDTEADAVRIANETRYGLAGGVWSASLDTALRVVKSVRTGKMFVNCYNNSGLEDLPHGGYKDSGLGREQGRYGLDGIPGKQDRANTDWHPAMRHCDVEGLPGCLEVRCRGRTGAEAATSDVPGGDRKPCRAQTGGGIDDHTDHRGRCCRQPCRGETPGNRGEGRLVRPEAEDRIHRHNGRSREGPAGGR